MTWQNKTVFRDYDQSMMLNVIFNIIYFLSYKFTLNALLLLKAGAKVQNADLSQTLVTKSRELNAMEQWSL